IGLLVAGGALHVLEACGEAPCHVRVERAPLAQHLEHVPAPGRGVPVAAGERHESHGWVQGAGGVEVVERRQELGRGEVAGGAEDREVAGGRHQPASLTAWPPKLLRIIARSFAPKSNLPWLANRIMSAVLMIGAGTPCSTASMAV